MALYTDTDGYPFLIFEWILYAISTLFVFARLYVQLRFRKRPYRELFVLVAWLFYLGNTVVDSLLNHLDWYNFHVFPKPDQALKIMWVGGMMYKPSLYACKAALLCFYADLNPRQFFAKTWRVLVTTWVFLGIAMIVQILFDSPISCLPFKLQMAFTDESRYTCALSLQKWSWASWSIHLFTDVLVYAIPFVILRNLKNLSKRDKRGAYAMFALGAFNILSALMLLINAVYSQLVQFEDPGPAFQGWTWANNWLMPFQQGSAIIIICLPYCRRLWNGTRAKDLRPELNTGNLQAHHMAIQADLEAGKASDAQSHSSAEGVVVISIETEEK